MRYASGEPLSYPELVVLAALLRMGRAGARDIARATGYSRRHVHRALRGLVEKGYARRVSRGVYEATGAARHARPRLHAYAMMFWKGLG